MQIRPVGADVFYSDRHEYDEAHSCIPNFANAPNDILQEETVFFRILIQDVVFRGNPHLTEVIDVISRHIIYISNFSEKNYPFFRILTNMRMEISTAARIHCRGYWRFGVTCISSFFPCWFLSFYFSSFVLTGRRGENDTLRPGFDSFWTYPVAAQGGFKKCKAPEYTSRSCSFYCAGVKLCSTCD